MNRDTASTIVIVAAALLTGVLYAVEAMGPIRAVVAIFFLLFGPGLALVRFLGLSDPPVVITLAVAVSLGVDAAISTALLATGQWSSGRALAILIVLTLGCVLLALAPALWNTRELTKRPREACWHMTSNLSL